MKTQIVITVSPGGPDKTELFDIEPAAAACAMASALLAVLRDAHLDDALWIELLDVLEDMEYWSHEAVSVDA